MRYFIKALLMLVFLYAIDAKAENKGFYAGSEYNYSYFRYQDTQLAGGLRFSDIAAEDFNGYAPYVGYRFTPHIALEGGYFGTLEESSSKRVGAVSYTGDTKYYSVFMDMVFSTPVLNNLQLLGSVGYERINAQIDLTATSGGTTSRQSVDNSVNGYRYGVGAEYAVTPDLAIRGMLRYIATDFRGVDGYFQGTLGLKYYFDFGV